MNRKRISGIMAILILCTGLIGMLNTPTLAETIPITEVFYGNGRQVFEQGIYVIATETNPVEMYPNYTNKKAYYEMLREHMTTEASTEQFISILVSRGICPSSGYSVGIESIERIANEFVISANLTEPGSGCIVFWMIINPVALIPIGSLPVGEYSITLQVDQYVRHCPSGWYGHIGTETWTATFNCSTEWITVTSSTVEMSLENKTTTLGEELSILMVAPTGVFRLPDTQVFDIYLYDSNYSLFSYWSQDKYFFYVMTSVPPGYNETLKWNLYHYDPSTGEFTPPPPGNYYLKGAIMPGPADFTPPILIRIDETTITPIAKTWTVDDDGPADFHTIQEAVNAASPGDIIFVNSGTYYEHLVVNKNISLIGESRSTTVIDGSRNGTVISVIADYVSISGFTIQNGYHIPHITYGIKIGEWKDGANNVTVEDNIILDNDIGIFVYYSSNSTILDNLVFNNYEGIDIVLSNDNRIERNSLFNNTVGIAVGSGGNSNMIRDNEISNSDFGIQVGWSINNYIVGNTISLNAYAGIRFDSSSNNSIIGNTITSSNRDGIVLFGSNSNTIMMNEIIQNKWDGIAVWYSNANIIYHNNFLNNTKQAGSYSGSTNTWDNGYPSGGNYWSNYKERYPDAMELDGSGIWDTPYVIDSDNVDRHPLIEPVTDLISRTIRIIDVTTGLDSVTLGSPTEPMPSDGYTFTVNVKINGTTNYLHSFRVVIAFDNTKVECTGAWIPKYDPSFVFYGAKFLMGSIGVYHDEGLVVLHSSLSSDYVIDGYPIRHYVNVTGDTLFGQINFTAIEPGASTLEVITTQEPIYPTWNTVLIDKDDNPIDFTAERFSVTTIALEPLHALTFNFTVGEETYRITTLSNSTISDFNFSQTLKQISFNVTGPTGTTGFCNVAIPDDLLWGEFVVYKDGSALVRGVDYTQIHNATHYIFYITYIHTTHVIEIRGTEVIQSDITPPTIFILSPENKTYTVSDVSLSFNVNESTSWIVYSLDSQANITIAGNTTLIGLSDGMHSLVVYASDITGNIGSSNMVYFTIQTATIDTTSPSISIVSPENKTYATTDISLTLTVDEIVSWMAYSLDGQANVTITGNTTLSGLSDGSHNLIVYAKDAAGNTGASEMVYFSIDTLQPEPFPWWILGAIAGIVVIGIALGTFFLRRKRPVKS